jgi:Tfp pilus assembly protein PilF
MKKVSVFLFCVLIFIPAAAHAVKPFRADAALTKAESQIAAEKYMQAVETLVPVLKRRPADPDALTYVGYIWMQMGDNAKAAQYIGRALKYDPRHLGANAYRAELFIAEKKLDRAIEQMQALRVACGLDDCAELDAVQSQINAARKGRTVKVTKEDAADEEETEDAEE